MEEDEEIGATNVGGRGTGTVTGDDADDQPGPVGGDSYKWAPLRAA